MDALLNHYELQLNWYAILQSIGFRVEVMEDFYWAIQPTLSKLQRLSLKLFSLSWKAKIIAYPLLKYLVINSIPGLFMPFTVSHKGEAFGYYLILERP